MVCIGVGATCYSDSVLAAFFAVIPFTNPVSNMIAGTNCPTTISAKKPRKIQTKMPLPSSAAAEAANDVAGASIPIIVASAFMTSSFCFTLPEFDCFCTL